MKKLLILTLIVSLFVGMVSCGNGTENNIDNNIQSVVTDNKKTEENENQEAIQMERVVYTDSSNFNIIPTEQKIVDGKENKSLTLDSKKLELNYSHSVFAASDKSISGEDVYTDADGNNYKFSTTTGVLKQFANQEAIDKKTDSSPVSKDEVSKAADDFLKLNQVGFDYAKMTKEETQYDKTFYSMIIYRMEIYGYKTNCSADLIINSYGEICSYDSGYADLYEQRASEITESDINDAWDYFRTSEYMTEKDVMPQKSIVLGDDGYLYLCVQTLRSNDANDSNSGLEQGLCCYVRIIPSK